MAELSDAFIALPGGVGTLEELFEVYTWAQLGIHAKPLGLLDVAGYYRPLVAFLDHAVQRALRAPVDALAARRQRGPRRPARRARGLAAAHRAQVDGPRPGVTAVFDGHNDALGKLQADDARAGGLPHRPARPRHRPPARPRRRPRRRAVRRSTRPRRARRGDAAASLWELPEFGPIDHAQATAFTAGAIGRAHALAAASDGAVAIVTDVAALDRCRADGTLAMVLHLEGAEAIDPGLAALDAWHAAGVRSIGLVWSRPSAFGHGVPFRFPASPDTGPGLTDAGRALVRRCAELRDRRRPQPPQRGRLRRRRAHRRGADRRLAHRAATRCAPRRATSPTSSCARSARSDGIVGIVFAPPSCAPTAPTTPTRRCPRSSPTCATPWRWPASTTSASARTSTARRCPPRWATWPGCRACSTRCATTASAPTRCERIAWGNWRRVLAAAWAPG